MSVKKAINDLIPPEWDYVLRKNKVLTKFIDYMYEFAYQLTGEITSIIEKQLKEFDLNSVEEF